MPRVPVSTSVLIVGGGPAGLTLAIELGRRAIPCILFDEAAGTTLHPKATSTQARTMEHYRRLGFAAEIRALGLPPDYPTDVAYFTRFSTLELGRFRLPASRDAAQMARGSSGSWSTPELPHRCPQNIIEAVLRKHAEKYPANSIQYGSHVTALRDLGTHVEADVELPAGAATVTCQYLVGCDGARGLTRTSLGISYTGEGASKRDFLGGKMCATHFRAPDLYSRIAGGPAWMYGAFNRERRAVMIAVNGVDEFVFHTQLRDEDECAALDVKQVQALFEKAMGCACPVEVINRYPWNAGYSLVAERYRSGRCFLAGDAAHLFTPTGGLGYNTGVDDAVNLGWKLAAVLNGWAGPALLDSYEAERLPIGHRNTRIAKSFADNIGKFPVDPAIEDQSPAGETARAEAARFLVEHASREFSIPGATFGVRYDASPLSMADAPPPEDTVNEYRPSAIPGGRAPHLWMNGTQSLYDLFGPEFTLLRFTPRAETRRWSESARALKVPLTILDVAEGYDLYGADLALIRPDQHIAWRGSDAVDPFTVLARTAVARGRELEASSC